MKIKKLIHFLKKYTFFSGRNYTSFVDKEKVNNYLDFFKELPIYFTVPEFILRNEELMKNLSLFATGKAFKNKMVTKESLTFFICCGIIKEALEQQSII